MSNRGREWPNLGDETCMIAVRYAPLPPCPPPSLLFLIRPSPINPHAHAWTMLPPSFNQPSILLLTGYMHDGLSKVPDNPFRHFQWLSKLSLPSHTSCKLLQSRPWLTGQVGGCDLAIRKKGLDRSLDLQLLVLSHFSTSSCLTVFQFSYLQSNCISH